jgi:regulatory protein
MKRGEIRSSPPVVPAFESALRLLGVRALTRPELGDRLARKGYGAAAIDDAIERLGRSGLLPPDAEILRRWAIGRIATRRVGPARLAAELLRRGMPRDEAPRLANELAGGEEEDALVDRELARLEKSVRLPREKIEKPGTKSGFPARRPSPEAMRRARIFDRLRRKGFSGEAIRRAFDRAKLAAPDEESDAS